ncbi:MAG: hypothetical protein R2712_31410, partial [Vicinamibacterales bacterium]
MTAPSGRRRRPPPDVAPPDAGAAAGPDHLAKWMPLAATLVLLLVSTTGRVQRDAMLMRAVWSAALVLLVWHTVLLARPAAAAPLRVQSRPRPQHYIQALCQLTVYAYWGFYWRPVYDYAWLLAAQLAFVYGLDMLLSWSRRGSYVLGFGPVPIVLSTNLFLWFRDDWYYLQFVMLTVGVLGKEFVRWERDGRWTHVFNPSAFSLGLFSLVLLATGTTDLTWGPEIASTLTLAPHIYLVLFLVGL